jgi:hypothetical protein
MLGALRPTFFALACRCVYSNDEGEGLSLSPTVLPGFQASQCTSGGAAGNEQAVLGRFLLRGKVAYNSKSN